MWLASVVLDVSTVFILGRDPAALENKGVQHPGVASVETALDAAVIYIQFRRLPKIFTDLVEKFLGLLAYRFKLLEKADFITLMLKERLENGYDHNDCGILFLLKDCVLVALICISILYATEDGL